jgi:hypothetical protein
LVGVQLHGSGPRLPANSALPCALSGTGELSLMKSGGLFGWIADERSDDRVDAIGCSHARPAGEHEPLHLEFERAGREIDPSRTALLSTRPMVEWRSRGLASIWRMRNHEAVTAPPILSFARSQKVQSGVT